jgi:hypothetical protein
MICKICKSESSFFAKGKIMGKYEISYFKCNNCGFIQTEDPHWLTESYSEAINRTDIGYVGRNLVLSKATARLINTFFDKNKKFIDYGAGYGLFVRLMRDLGYDFYGSDKYCDSVFAKDFEADENYKDYELLTAFEVFEHLENPVSDMEQMTKFSRNIFFSTQLVPADYPKPGDWWYYGLEHGQHIALYSRKSLEILGSKFGLNLYTDNNNFHLFTSKKINSVLFRFNSFYKKFHSFRQFSNSRSLLMKDYDNILKSMEIDNQTK